MAVAGAPQIVCGNNAGGEHFWSSKRRVRREPVQEETPVFAEQITVSAPDQIVWLDVTDLLAFLQEHRHVSGIQRVQYGYIIKILDHAGSNRATRWKFCARQQSRSLVGGYGKRRGNLLARAISPCFSRAAGGPRSGGRSACPHEPRRRALHPR